MVGDFYGFYPWKKCFFENQLGVHLLFIPPTPFIHYFLLSFIHSLTHSSYNKNNYSPSNTFHFFFIICNEINFRVSWERDVHCFLVGNNMMLKNSLLHSWITCMRYGYSFVFYNVQLQFLASLYL